VMLYTGTLMSETVFYPIFLAVALVLVLALERPTPFRQLLLVAACVVAFLARSQAIVLLPTVATAPLVLAWLDRRGRRAVGDFRVLYGALAALVVGVLAFQLARGHSPYDVLGSYNVTGSAHYSPGEVLRWLLYHVAELDLYLGVVPFAALLLLAAMGRSLDRPLRVFLAAALPLAAWLVLEVATFASTWSDRVQERNMSYVAPLFLIALLAWIERGMPRPARATTAVALVAAALPGALPYHSLISESAKSDTLALMPLWWLQENVVSSATIPVVVVLAAVAVASAFVFLTPRWALVLPAIVAAWFVFTIERVEDFDHGFHKSSEGALFQGITTGTRDWVDRAVGRDADVAFVFSGKDPTLTLWENEFFNRSIGPVYDLLQPSMGELPEHKVTQRADGVLVSEGRPVRHSYVLTDTSVPLAGMLVAADEPKRIVLLQTDGLVRIGQRVEGLYRDDTWSGRRVTYTRLRCTGGRVSVDLAGDAKLFGNRPQTVRAAGGKVTFAQDQRAELIVPLRPRNGVCRVVFTVDRTAIPAVVRPGNGDGRVLGAHFLAFRYTEP
jgi:hypothetical protein